MTQTQWTVPPESGPLEGRILFGNATFFCSRNNVCHTLGHIAVAAVAPDIIGDITIGASVSLDNGTSWNAAGKATWLAKFDRAPRESGGDNSTWQRHHIGVDLAQEGTEKAPTSLCVEAWAMHAGVQVWIDMVRGLPSIHAPGGWTIRGQHGPARCWKPPHVHR